MAKEVSSKVTLTSKDYLAEAKMRHHFSVLDRPIEEGGGDTGPTPVEYLLSAIAGCVSMTLKVFLKRKNWDVGNITVEVFKTQKLTQKGIENILTEEISFEKKITEFQKTELLRIAGTCSVVKMIKQETKISSKII